MFSLGLKKSLSLAAFIFQLNSVHLSERRTVYPYLSSEMLERITETTRQVTPIVGKTAVRYFSSK